MEGEWEEEEFERLYEEEMAMMREQEGTVFYFWSRLRAVILTVNGYELLLEEAK